MAKAQSRASAGKRTGKAAASSKAETGAWFGAGYDKVKEEAARSNFSDEFRLNDGESAKIRFLTEEPVTFRQHNPAIDGKWPKYTCRQGLQGGCPLCKAGDNPRFVGVLTVYDYRDKKVKLYIQGIRVLKVLDKLHLRKGGLMAQDFEISRSGKKTDTTYNFIPLAPTAMPKEAKDEKGELKVIDVRRLFAPKDVDILQGVSHKLGSSAPAESGAAGGGEEGGEQESYSSGGKVKF